MADSVRHRNGLVRGLLFAGVALGAFVAWRVYVIHDNQAKLDTLERMLRDSWGATWQLDRETGIIRRTEGPK